MKTTSLHKRFRSSHAAILCALASTLAMVNMANAQALVYESFSFATDGTKLAGNTGDTGLGTWSNTGTTQTPAADMSFGDLQTGGGSAQIGSLWGRVSAPITADMSSLLVDGGEMWFSVRVAKNAGDLARIGLAIGDSAASTNGVLVDEDSNAGTAEQALGGFLSRNTGKFHSLIWTTNSMSTSNFQSATSPTETTASDLTLNAGNSYSVLVVGHVQWGADGNANDILTLYAPDAGSLGTVGAVRAVSQGVVSQQSFDTLSLATGSNTNPVGVAFYDEIRIGASYADVVPVPEPGTFALMAGCLALTSIMLRRRRC